MAAPSVGPLARYTCPICERELRSAIAWHNCVKTSMDELLASRMG